MRSESQGGSILLFVLISASLLGLSALVLGLGHRSLERSRAYRAEALALTAAQSALALGRLGWDRDSDYAGESGELNSGAQYEVSVEEASQGFLLVCKGTFTMADGRRATRWIRWAPDGSLGRGLLLPRAELAGRPLGALGDGS